MVRTAVFLCAIFLTSQAFACGIMEKSDPRVGSTVAPPDHITLYFSERFDVKQSSITITDENGTEIPAGNPVNKGLTLWVSLKPPLPAGTYKVTWDVLWRDCGSKTQGDFKFSVQAP